MFVFLLSKNSPKKKKKSHPPWGYNLGVHERLVFPRAVACIGLKKGVGWASGYKIHMKKSTGISHSKPGMDLVTSHDGARIRDSQESFLTKSGLDSDTADYPQVPTNRQALFCAPWHSSSSCPPTVPQGGSFYLTHEKMKAQEAQRRLRANSWQIQKVDWDPPTPALLLSDGAASLLGVDAGMHGLENWTGQRAEVWLQRD